MPRRESSAPTDTSLVGDRPTPHRFKPTADAVRAFLVAQRKTWLASGWDNALCDTVEIVLAEVLNNVAEHAHPTDPENGTVQVVLTREDQDVVLEIQDDGLAMPRLELPNRDAPALDVAISDLPEGGFGWFMIRTLAKTACYNRINNWNHVRITIPFDVS